MINWTRVTELRDEVGAEDFAEIAEVFLTELDGTVSELGGQSARESLRDGYHALKGAALNLGFDAVSSLAAAAENDPVSADLAKIASACRAASDALRDRYPEIAG